MENAIRTLFFIVAVIGVSLPQSQRCIYSRLDVIPCIYRNKQLMTASQNNQYQIHHTRLRNSDSGLIDCNVRPKQQVVADVTDYNTEQMRLLHSPGFIVNDPPFYDNQLLVQYNIDCGEGTLAFFNITTMDLQGEDDCGDDDGNKRCQDYIIIDRDEFGTDEFCGSDSLIELKLNVGKFKVLFRSSEEVKGTGFQMYIICFREEERDPPGCLRPSDFNQSVCLGNSSDMDVGGPDISNDGRRKRDAFAEGLTYRDFFPKYPHAMRIREDVANFHSQWQRQRRQAKRNYRFIMRPILFNESVSYSNNVIRIFNADNVQIKRFGVVVLLQTLDADGQVTNYVGGVNINRFPHFSGPGPLVIAGRNAFFQLFIIDPRGLIPNPEEEQDLIALNRPLLDSVPLSEDHDVFEPNQTMTPFPFLFPDDGKRKREVQDFDSSSSRRRRQADEGFSVPFSNESVFLILQSLEACNPVLKEQARARLKIFENNETTRVQLDNLRNFTITCNLNATHLRCEVNDSSDPVLPERSYCQINNEADIEKCEPFYPSYELPERDVEISSVTVTAINCNGQRVKHTVQSGTSNG